LTFGEHPPHLTLHVTSGVTKQRKQTWPADEIVKRPFAEFHKKTLTYGCLTVTTNTDVMTLVSLQLPTAPITFLLLPPPPPPLCSSYIKTALRHQSTAEGRSASSNSSPRLHLRRPRSSPSPCLPDSLSPSLTPSLPPLLVRGTSSVTSSDTLGMPSCNPPPPPPPPPPLSPLLL